MLYRNYYINFIQILWFFGTLGSCYEELAMDSISPYDIDAHMGVSKAYLSLSPGRLLITNLHLIAILLLRS